MQRIVAIFLSLFKAAPLSTNIYVASRLPHVAGACSSVESSPFVMSTDIPLSSKILIISTLAEEAAW